MPQSSAPSTDTDARDPAPMVLPRPAINLALRALQLMSGVQYLELRVVSINGVWHLLGPGGKLEKLG